MGLAEKESDARFGEAKDMDMRDEEQVLSSKWVDAILDAWN